MALSFERYPGDGTTTDFSVPFGYIARSHIEVRVDGVTASFTFLNDTTIRLDVAAGASTVVEVRRNTPTTPLVNFEDSAVQTEAQLDLAILQTLYVSEEAKDLNEDALSKDASGNFDAESLRIINLAAPVDGGDVVNKTYADTIIDQASVFADNAQASALNAAASESAALAAEVAAEAAQTAAAASAVEAAASATSINPASLMPKTGGAFTGVVSAPDPVSGNDLVNISWADGRYFAKSGGTITGTLTMGAGAQIIAIAGSLPSPSVRIGSIHGFYALSATSLRVNVNGAFAAEFGEAGSTAAEVQTIITREKGDARYEQGLYLHVQDRKTSGTNGGATVASIWTVRVLNTVVGNTITGASLANNQVTLPAGNYEVYARSPFGWGGGMNYTGRFRATDGSVEVLGSVGSNGGSGSSQDDTWVLGRFTIASTTIFTLNYWCNIVRATDGLGRAVGSGQQEVYAEVYIKKMPG